MGQGQTQCGSWYGFVPMLAPGVEACPLLLVGVGSLVLSVKMEVLGEKANWLPIQSWFPGATGGPALEESAGVSKNQTCGGEKQSFLLPCSKFLKYTHVLLSDVEKPHSGRADKKVVIKELCLYDDIAPVGENREGKTVSVTVHGTTSTWCPCGFSRLGTWTPRALVWASQSLFRVRCGGAHP